MGIRGHIQTRQPEYEGGCISSWKSDAYLSFLIGHDIDVTEHGGGETWEIYIDDNLRALTRELLDGKHLDEINAHFSNEDLKCAGNAHELGAFLKCGIDVGDARGYPFVIVDFF